MRNKLIEFFRMPQKAVINRKIAKKQFFEQGQLTNNEKELLTSEIDSIYLLSICRQDTLNIPKFINEVVRYEEVYWLYVSFKSLRKYEQMIKLIHKTFLNPIIIIAADENENLSISTAHKRLNQNDHSKVVVDGVNHSHWSQLDTSDEANQRFMNRVCFSNLSYKNLFDFYDSVHVSVTMSSLIETVNNYPEKAANSIKVVNLIEKLKQVDETIKTLNQSKQEHLDFGEKMGHHIKIKMQQQERECLLKQLKEFC